MSDEITYEALPLLDDSIIYVDQDKRFRVLGKGTIEGQVMLVDQRGDEFSLSPSVVQEELDDGDFQLPENLAKYQYSRVGFKTEVANPDEPLLYAEYTDPPFSIEYDPYDTGTYSVRTRIWKNGDVGTDVYHHREEVSEETVDEILTTENDGQWGYVE
jgi:hypothetical protein